MPEDEQQITIEMEPVYVPESEIIEPTLPGETAPEEIPKDYEALQTITIEMEPLPEIQPTPERELIVNVETTGTNPWDSHIVSISYVDLSLPSPTIVVLIDEDEQALVKDFLDWFNAQQFTRLVGFKTNFDHRFIFAKAMKYRLRADLWAATPERDIKQILDQVQEAFIYFSTKTGTMDDWGKELLGYGKLGEQAEFLKKYLAKDWDYVQAFSERQVLLTYELYALIRYSLAESDWLIPQIEAETGQISTILGSEGITIKQKTKQCPNCFAYNYPEASTCEICGKAF